MFPDPICLADWTLGKWVPHPPAGVVRGICQDTRRLCAGDMYVALLGPRFDGHDFTVAARERGAAAAMVAESYANDALRDWPLLRVKDTKQALWDAASGYRAGWGARVIGITGSVGKTTVKELIAHLLGGSGCGLPVAKTYANWNNDIGLPLSLLNSPGDAGYAVFEVGTNHPGELAPLADLLRPSVGVVTTIGEAHLENFGTVRAIAHEKAALLRALPVDGVAVLNCDHEEFDTLKAALTCRLVTVSMDEASGADYRMVRLEMQAAGELGLTFRDAAGQQRRIEAPLSGRHQAANLLLAAAVVMELGFDGDAIQPALRNFSLPAMRWQRIKFRGVTLINDAYNANPLSMRSAIETFSIETAPNQRSWLVLGGMLELGSAADKAHQAIGHLLAGKVWQGIVTVGEKAAGIAAGARAAGFPPDAIWECDDAAGAAAVLRRMLRPGDAVLLKGSRAFKLESVISALENES